MPAERPAAGTAEAVRLPAGGPLDRVRRGLAFFLEYQRLSIATALEYRASALGQVLAMFINDGMWLAFWWLYFTRFPVVRGWEREDVVMLWAILAFGFGLATGLFGNIGQLARLIAEGGLDYYLALPKPAFGHVLLGRASFYSLGDVVFGCVVFALWGRPDLERTALFVASGLVAGAIFVWFYTLAQSLAFYLGHADVLAGQLQSALIHLSTHPSSIFEGPARWILFSVIPAGFVSSLPVAVLRRGDLGYLGLLVLVAAGFGLLAYGAFTFGLRRYASGNLVHLRG